MSFDVLGGLLDKSYRLLGEAIRKYTNYFIKGREICRMKMEEVSVKCPELCVS